jgi:competence protein ComEC
LDKELHYGDTIRIRGRVEEQKLFSNQKNNLPKKRLVVKNPKIEFVKSEQSAILAPASFIRQKIISTFIASLPKDEAGLFLGIVFGIKNEMNPYLLNAFRDTGILHVVAASGMNVTMAANLLFSLFASFLRRQIALGASILGIFFYTLLTGFQPSIIRAAIMAIFAYSAQILGRQNFSFLSLSFAAFLMLFFSPAFLFDVGFQLSFLSTLGLLTTKPIFDSWFGKRRIFEDFSTTLSAQIWTLPVLVSTFSSYSPVSILVNSLILWTVPPIMFLGFIGAFLSIISPFLSQPFLLLAFPLLLFFKETVFLFAKVAPVFSFALPSSFFIAYYLFLLAALLKK